MKGEESCWLQDAQDGALTVASAAYLAANYGIDALPCDSLDQLVHKLGSNQPLTDVPLQLDQANEVIAVPEPDEVLHLPSQRRRDRATTEYTNVSPKSDTTVNPRP